VRSPNTRLTLRFSACPTTAPPCGSELGRRHPNRDGDQRGHGDHSGDRLADSLQGRPAGDPRPAGVAYGRPHHGTGALRQRGPGRTSKLGRCHADGNHFALGHTAGGRPKTGARYNKEQLQRTEVGGAVAFVFANIVKLTGVFVRKAAPLAVGSRKMKLYKMKLYFKQKCQKSYERGIKNA